MVSLRGVGPGGRPSETEFRGLRYFAAVAGELHSGRAAARLFITQPGLSHAIARPGRLLQVRLFTRARSSVELTGAVAELLARGRRLLAGLDGTVARVPHGRARPGRATAARMAGTW